MKLKTDGRTTDGQTEPSHPISSPGAFGSGELKITKMAGTIFDHIAVTLLIPTRTIHFCKNPRFRPWSSVVMFSNR